MFKTLKCVKINVAQISLRLDYLQQPCPWLALNVSDLEVLGKDIYILVCKNLYDPSGKQQQQQQKSLKEHTGLKSPQTMGEKRDVAVVN